MKIDGIEVKQCIGSGFCCMNAPCYIASNKYDDKWTSPCPSLAWSEKDFRYYCQEVLDNPDLKAPLSIGGGCCQSLFNVNRDQLKQGIKPEIGERSEWLNSQLVFREEQRSRQSQI